MIKAFLSHSSADKGRYVRVVADKLGDQNCVYDEYTFEAGMKPLEEIMKGLDASQLFVVFLSSQALASKWVQDEMALAHKKLNENELVRIFPIIIDEKLTYHDDRIPDWMRNEYNLKYVSRPTVAARRIRQRLREISWMHNPRLKERDSIFVGRNDLIKAIEERIDDFDQPSVSVFVASGLPRVGRSALLRNGLIKSGVVSQPYEFPSIVLHAGEGIEDLILKLYDLSFSQLPYPTDLMTISMDDKIALAVKIVQEIQGVKEIVLIRDEGCLVDRERDLQPWFKEILARTASDSRPSFLIVTNFRPAPGKMRPMTYVSNIGVPELDYTERRGLFKRLLEFEKIALSHDDFVFFSNLFQGFPEQIRYTCDLINDLGLTGARNVTYLITEFNSERASMVLSKYSGDPKASDFLRLLAQFELISIDFLFSIVDEMEYSPILNELIASSICDHVGIEKEFVHLNDSIRDYVQRNRLGIPELFNRKLSDHLDRFLEDPNEEDRDVSDLLYSVKEAIKAGKAVRDRYLIPSHFLTSIRELYRERGHIDQVIQLCYKLLEKEHLLDSMVSRNVRYYLCLSLARKRDERMLTEVQKIPGIERDFLLGFYYRLKGRYADALLRLKKCESVSLVSLRARGELVRVYLSIEDYDAALVLAKPLYEESPKNPYSIQAYLDTVLNSPNTSEQRELIERLIEELEAVGSDLSAEMALIAKAEFAAKCDSNYQRAMDLISDAHSRFSDSPYPLLAKGFLAVRQKDVKGLEEAYAKLGAIAKMRNVSENSMTRLKASLIALKGNLPDAISYAEANLKKIPEYSRDKFLNSLRALQ